MEFTYKNCVFILIFKLQSPSKYSPFDVIHLSKHFFHYSKQFLNSVILMLFETLVASAFFFSPLPHWQNISF